MLLAGIFKLGRYVRFVSHSVMIGFLTGVGANIVLSQLADFTGGNADGGVALTRAWSVLTAPGDWYLPTLAAGQITLGLVAWLGNTRLSPYSALLALVAPTVVLEILGTSGVRRVKDVGEIPSGVPFPISLASVRSASTSSSERLPTPNSAAPGHRSFHVARRADGNRAPRRSATPLPG